MAIPMVTWREYPAKMGGQLHAGEEEWNWTDGECESCRSRPARHAVASVDPTVLYLLTAWLKYTEVA